MDNTRLYYIEQECLKCDACDNTGWRRIDIARSREQAKKFKKHWKKYFGQELKIRIKPGKKPV